MVWIRGFIPNILVSSGDVDNECKKKPRSSQVCSFQVRYKNAVSPQRSSQGRCIPSSLGISIAHNHNDLTMHLYLLMVAATAGASLHHRPTVLIADGLVVGTTTSLPAATATVNQFLGIPFAKSPPERFGLPQPPTPFRGELDASKFKDSCMQQFNCEFWVDFLNVFRHELEIRCELSLN